MDLVAGASNNAVISLVSKLGSLLAEEYTLISGVSDDIQYINDELASMQAFLNRLQREAGGHGHNEQRQDWMKQVREVAYDIEDYIDNVRHRLHGEPIGSGRLAALRRAWYMLTTLYARHCIATDIGNLKARAQHVSERRTRYGVENPAMVDADSDAGNIPRDRPTPPPQLISTMEPVAIGDAMEKLKPQFMKMERQPQLRFVAIVGFGGLGKTTLAMALYRMFGDEFDCRATVLASQKFNLRRVLQSLVYTFHERFSGTSKNDLDGIEEWTEARLKNRLADLLTGRRYLILIDDIWSVSAWENLRDSLPGNEKGGTIVVTTRFKSVSEACRRRSGYVYEHTPLSEESSYKLFSEAMSSSSYDQPVNIRLIMKICGGLPLAIVVVAGLMASKLKSETSNLDTQLQDLDEQLRAVLGNNLTTEGVTQILNYCYKNLPSDLKTCLLYLSMFPKGGLISRKRLIRRWTAEGLISEKHGRTVEEIAEECFDELISRNLIRTVYSSSSGKVKTCLVHDMVLEYIVSKSSEENFITVVGGHWQTQFPSYKVRRLTIHRSDQQVKHMVERMKLSHVRSLTALEISFRSLHSAMHKLQILQVLDLESCKDLSYNKLKKICSLHQLKYLSLRQTDTKKIPSNISRLEYLEVFDIRDTDVRKLPGSVERLQRMAHLLAGNKSKRRALKLTEGITKMTALQTLSGVEIYGRSDGAAKRGFIDKKKPSARASNISLGKKQRSLADLEKLTNLKKLTIYRLVSFTDRDNELLLSAIEHLSSCSLKVFSIDDDFCNFLDSSLTDSQAPPEHLYALGLSGKLFEVPKWINRLHSLEKLTLSLTSLKTSTLPVLADLPELFSLIFTLDSANTSESVLRILRENAMKSDGHIFVPAGGFKKLKLLRFLAPVLPSLIFDDGAMPELQKLELRFVMIEEVYGLEHLKSLRQVVLTVSNQAPEVARAKASQIKLLASISPSQPSVLLDEYNELS